MTVFDRLGRAREVSRFTIEKERGDNFLTTAKVHGIHGPITFTVIELFRFLAVERVAEGDVRFR